MIIVVIVCVFLFVAWIFYTAKGQDDEAIDEAIEDSSNDAVAYFNRGVAYYFKRQYDRAIENYNKAIQLNPNLAEAYVTRGVAYKHKGQLDKARSDFQTACNMGCEEGCKALKREGTRSQGGKT
jgi:tetratricopeptide (TPR) repeat protein